MAGVRSVGVVGAGTMGLGIAQVCASAGFETILYDINPAQVERALAAIQKNLLVQVEKGKLNPLQRQQTLARIRSAKSLSDLRVSLVIEAAVEQLELKQDLFRKLESINEPETILATNTSSISVDRIADSLKSPQRCIGLHFFNPADRMQLVEIVAGKKTPAALVEEMKVFASALGKTSVIVKDSPGFVVNRVARPFYAESLQLLEEKVANTSGIDSLLRSAGFRMGPFELMDLIGVDTNLAVTTSVYEGMGKPPRFKPSDIQKDLVKEGRYGKKSGKGFYEYPA